MSTLELDTEEGTRIARALREELERRHDAKRGWTSTLSLARATATPVDRTLQVLEALTWAGIARKWQQRTTRQLAWQLVPGSGRTWRE